MGLEALVAVRSGSQRVKNKNIRPFAGSSLLEIKIEQLKRIPLIDRITVNSNDDTMLSIAGRLGCKTVKRDDYYAGNAVSMSEVYCNMAKHCEYKDIAYINVTNPLVYDSTIIQAINQYYQLEDRYDSLNSAHLVKEFLFMDNQPLNYDLKHQPRSQDLPDIAALNFAVNIISRDKMIECKNVVGYKPYLYIVNEVESTDIDNLIDFEFAEFAYLRRGEKFYAERNDCSTCV